MNDWPVIFLGVIAVSTLAMALVQVGAIIATLKLAREAQAVLTSIKEDVRPVIAKAATLADDASRTVALATAQMQKVDRLVTDVAKRVDDTSSVVQHAIVTPARQAAAIGAAIKAALGVLRHMGDHRGAGRHTEEDDALFIG